MTATRLVGSNNNCLSEFSSRSSVRRINGKKKATMLPEATSLIRLAGTSLLLLFTCARATALTSSSGHPLANPNEFHLRSHNLESPSSQPSPLSDSQAQQQQQQQQPQQQRNDELNHHPISALSSLIGGSSETSGLPGKGSAMAQQATSGSKSRSPRSIGDMFKKLFNGNKRSKSSQSARDYDQQQVQQVQQQQLQQAQQFQQFQQAQQNQIAAVNQLAAAAANQHAVYASPFASAYSQFTPTYWAPSAAAIRATPTLLGAAAGAGSPLALAASPAGALYAAASQPYTSYVPPPPAVAAATPSAGQLSAAASQQYPSAVPAPSGMQASGSSPAGSTSGPAAGGASSLDFHQVLDALVRTSGFAPAGDPQEAAASRPEGTPVFSFRKLVSLPFYLSSEEKSLEGLANAAGMSGAHAGAYSLPIMRRHVRRMSASPSSLNNQQQHQQQQQQQQQLNQHLANFQVADPSQRSEREQRERYTNYFNALNNQLASMTANNQLMQFLTRQQNQPSIASQVEAYTADAALASYQLGQSLASPQTPYKRAQSATSGGASGGLSTSASMLSPMSVQAPPPGQFQSYKAQQQQQFASEQERELHNLLASMQQQLSPSNAAPLDSYSTAAATTYPTYQLPPSFSLMDGTTHRYGAQQQQQQQYYAPSINNNNLASSASNYYWPNSIPSQTAATQVLSSSHISADSPMGSNGNLLISGNNQLGEQLSPSSSLGSAAGSSSSTLINSQQQQQQQQSPSSQVSSAINAQNNALDRQQLDHLSQQQVAGSGISAQQQQQQQQSVAPTSSLIDGSVSQQQQQQSASSTQQVNSSLGNNNIFHSQASLNAEQSQQKLE